MDDAGNGAGALRGSVLNPGERMVTLIDGREVSNYSEEWRHECEARMVCKMQGFTHVDPKTGKQSRISGRSERNIHIHKVGEKRGPEAAQKLRDLVFVIWNAEFR